ncbi:hypothetical protein T12_4573 [Trichinella patagoniensis]|uniref:Uncharacterized protein n=1 Tax=Trichinella patagoniensis TaxID=990121 RepID=A0A0V1A2F3_9BILA|nr:hypothetical protein T12_4573 [Trichinella patagoniensis]
MQTSAKLSEDKEAFNERAISSAGQTTHRNEISKSKIYAQSKHAFICYGLPQNHIGYRYLL